MKKTFSTLAELFNEMYKLGIENMKAFYTDIIIDADTITSSVNKDGEPFVIYWVVRKSGTRICYHEYSAIHAKCSYANEYLFTAKIQKEESGFSLEITDKAA